MRDKQETISAGRNVYGTTNETGASCPWPRSKSTIPGRLKYGTITNEEKGTSYKCDQCSDEFWTRDALKEHKKNIHKQNSVCSTCKCDMGDHDSNGQCDNCGKQCG